MADKSGENVSKSGDPEEMSKEKPSDDKGKKIRDPMYKIRSNTIFVADEARSVNGKLQYAFQLAFVPRKLGGKIVGYFQQNVSDGKNPRALLGDKISVEDAKKEISDYKYQVEFEGKDGKSMQFRSSSWRRTMMKYTKRLDKSADPKSETSDSFKTPQKKTNETDDMDTEKTEVSSGVPPTPQKIDDSEKPSPKNLEGDISKTKLSTPTAISGTDPFTPNEKNDARVGVDTAQSDIVEVDNERSQAVKKDENMKRNEILDETFAREQKRKVQELDLRKELRAAKKLFENVAESTNYSAMNRNDIESLNIAKSNYKKAREKLDNFLRYSSYEPRTVEKLPLLDTDNKADRMQVEAANEEAETQAAVFPLQLQSNQQVQQSADNVLGDNALSGEAPNQFNIMETAHEVAKTKPEQEINLKNMTVGVGGQNEADSLQDAMPETISDLAGVAGANRAKAAATLLATDPRFQPSSNEMMPSMDDQPQQTDQGGKGEEMKTQAQEDLEAARARQDRILKTMDALADANLSPEEMMQYFDSNADAFDMEQQNLVYGKLLEFARNYDPLTNAAPAQADDVLDQDMQDAKPDLSTSKRSTFNPQVARNFFRNNVDRYRQTLNDPHTEVLLTVVQEFVVAKYQKWRGQNVNVVANRYEALGDALKNGYSPYHSHERTDMSFMDETVGEFLFWLIHSEFSGNLNEQGWRQIMLSAAFLTNEPFSDSQLNWIITGDANAVMTPDFDFQTDADFRSEMEEHYHSLAVQARRQQPLTEYPNRSVPVEPVPDKSVHPDGSTYLTREGDGGPALTPSIVSNIPDPRYSKIGGRLVPNTKIRTYLNPKWKVGSKEPRILTRVEPDVAGGAKDVQAQVDSAQADMLLKSIFTKVYAPIHAQAVDRYFGSTNYARVTQPPDFYFKYYTQQNFGPDDYEALLKWNRFVMMLYGPFLYAFVTDNDMQQREPVFNDLKFKRDITLEFMELNELMREVKKYQQNCDERSQRVVASGAAQRPLEEHLNKFAQDQREIEKQNMGNQNAVIVSLPTNVDPGNQPAIAPGLGPGPAGGGSTSNTPTNPVPQQPMTTQNGMFMTSTMNNTPQHITRPSDHMFNDMFEGTYLEKKEPRPLMFSGGQRDAYQNPVPMANVQQFYQPTGVPPIVMDQGIQPSSVLGKRLLNRSTPQNESVMKRAKMYDMFRR